MDATRTWPVSRDAGAEHYVWGGDCDGWRLVDTPGLSVIHERMPPGRAETRHRHAAARQFFLVLAGTLAIEVEGELHALAQGTGLEIAPGAAHQVFNHSFDPVEFLVISQPSTRGDREDAPHGPA